MVKRVGILLSAVFILCAAIAPSCFASGPLSEVNIGQAHIYTDLLHTYIDMTDAGGGRAAQPDIGYVRGTMDGELLSIDNIKKFTDTKEGSAYIFLFDVSGSLSSDRFEKLRAATKNWCQKMGENDRMAIMTFGNEVKTPLDFSADKAQINSVVDSLSNSDGETRLYDAVCEGLKLSEKRGDDIPKRKVIILLSDGKNDVSGGSGRDDVIDLTKKHMIPVYSLCTAAKNSNSGSSFMNELCELSHGMFFNISETGIDEVYNRAYERLMNAYIIDFKYPSSKTDGKMHNLTISVIENGTEFSDTRELYMEKPTESIIPAAANVAASEEENSNMNGIPKTTLLIFIIIGVVILAAIVGVAALMVVLNGKKKTQGHMPPPPVYPPANNPAASDRTVALGGSAAAPKPQSGGPKFTLSELNGNGVFTADASDRIVIGRKSDCNIILKDSQVSGHHCSVTRRGGSFYVTDMGSTNGTIVNGIQISSETELKSGDLIMLGTKEYKVN